MKSLSKNYESPSAYEVILSENVLVCVSPDVSNEGYDTDIFEW